MDNSEFHTETVKQCDNLLTNMLKKIGKYRFHYLIAAPFVILLIFFKIIPLIGSFCMAFTKFDMARFGVSLVTVGDFIGFDNFKALFTTEDFWRVFCNTIIMKVEFILLCGIVSLVLAVALGSLVSERVKRFFSTLFLIPYFIPGAVLAYLAIMLLSPSRSPFSGHIDKLILADETYFRLIFLVVEVIRNCGIPVIIALGAIASRASKTQRDITFDGEQRVNFFNEKIIPAVRAIIAFFIIQASILLTSDFEILYIIINAKVKLVGETLEIYSYSSGFGAGQFSTVETITIIKFVIQLMLTLGAYYLLKKLFRDDLFQQSTINMPPKQTCAEYTRIGLIPAAFYTLVVAIPIFFLFVYPFITKGGTQSGISYILAMRPFVRSYIIYLGVTIIAVILNSLVCTALAYPLTVKGLPGRTLYKFVLLTVMCVSGISISEYSFYQIIGSGNMFLPYISLGMFSVINIFVIKEIYNRKYSNAKDELLKQKGDSIKMFFTEYLRKIWRTIIGLGVLQFSVLWNSYFTSLTLANKPQGFSPTAYFLRFAQNAKMFGINDLVSANVLQLKYGLLVSIPPIVLFLIFRRYLTSEVFISQTRK